MRGSCVVFQSVVTHTHTHTHTHTMKQEHVRQTHNKSALTVNRKTQRHIKKQNEPVDSTEALFGL